MEAEHLPRARYVLKLVDYQDIYESELQEHLTETGLEALSVFGLDSIIEGMSRMRRNTVLKILEASNYERYV